MGSAVNLAARLETAASPGEVWVGEETFEATRHRLYYAPSPILKLRGFPEVTRAYHFTERMHARDPYAHLSFVGRARERSVLRRALDEVRRTGEVKEVRLIGKAGSGKTRLLREFCKEVKRQRAAQVVWLEPNTFSADLPLEPLLLSSNLQDKPLLLIAEPSAAQEALLLERAAAGCAHREAEPQRGAGRINSNTPTHAAEYRRKFGAPRAAYPSRIQASSRGAGDASGRRPRARHRVGAGVGRGALRHPAQLAHLTFAGAPRSAATECSAAPSPTRACWRALLGRSRCDAYVTG